MKKITVVKANVAKPVLKIKALTVYEIYEESTGDWFCYGQEYSLAKARSVAKRLDGPTVIVSAHLPAVEM
ncbi:hypothetical protein LCGC14_0297840 [marine sediment metagenome]|uniref:Uncharacterized protein n=1 Tax=marine sediment metagenome TaxID=412755 RepID=A0A0F9TR54_9ZZZZ